MRVPSTIFVATRFSAFPTLIMSIGCLCLLTVMGCEGEFEESPEALDLARIRAGRTDPADSDESVFVPVLPEVPDISTRLDAVDAPAGTARTQAVQLSVEMRLLSRARDLKASDPVQAYAIAEEHRRRFPEGLLVQDREVLAIEALLLLQRAPEAERRYYAFRRMFPESEYLGRLARIIAYEPPR